MYVSLICFHQFKAETYLSYSKWALTTQTNFLKPLANFNRHERDTFHLNMLGYYDYDFFIHDKIDLIDLKETFIE